MNGAVGESGARWEVGREGGRAPNRAGLVHSSFPWVSLEREHQIIQNISLHGYDPKR